MYCGHYSMVHYAWNYFYMLDNKKTPTLSNNEIKNGCRKYAKIKLVIFLTTTLMLSYVELNIYFPVWLDTIKVIPHNKILAHHNKS